MRAATDVFDEWATEGRDAGMERGHAAAVDELLDAAIDHLEAAGRVPYTAIDAGCGNGWVVRRLSAHLACEEAIGVDGASAMIHRARELDPDGTYHLADLATWNPDEPVDLVHSMEVLYYLDDIPGFLRRVHDSWLNEHGVLVIGVDHHAGNPSSLSWPEDVGVRMTTHSEPEWRALLEDAGFTILRSWLAATDKGDEDWTGTLAMLAVA